MPRGFLVKRNRNWAAVSYRSRVPDLDLDELTVGYADMGSGLVVHCSQNNPYDSPDSGYGSSPVIRTPEEQIPSVPFGNFSPVSAVYKPVSFSTPNTSTASTPSNQTFEMNNLYKSEKLFTPIIKIPTRTPVVESSLSKRSPVRKRPHSVDPCTRTSKPRRTGRKPKAARKINFDNDAVSPVLGTFIRASCDIKEKQGSVKTNEYSDCGQRGLFVCKLCREDYHNPLSLAQHKCSRIAHVEYRCTECDKVFNCHANLASHRRWHKPRLVLDSPTNHHYIPPSSDSAVPNECTLIVPDAGAHAPGSVGSESSCSPRSTPSPTGIARKASPLHECEHCGKTYRRPAYLRRHLRNHGESETHQCYNCGQTFSSLTGRAKHVLSQICQDIDIGGGENFQD